jgi:hypothetical protein
MPTKARRLREIELRKGRVLGSTKVQSQDSGKWRVNREAINWWLKFWGYPLDPKPQKAPAKFVVMADD